MGRGGVIAWALHVGSNIAEAAFEVGVYQTFSMEGRVANM